MGGWELAVAIAGGLATLAGGAAVVSKVAAPLVAPVAKGWREARQAVLDVPVIRKRLEEHERRDDERFTEQAQATTALDKRTDRLDRKLDRMARDVRWLVKQAGGPDDDEE